MKINVDNLTPDLSGWVIVDMKANERGEIAREDIGKGTFLTIPVWGNPGKQALAVFDTRENAVRYRDVVPPALLSGHRWDYWYLAPEALAGYLLGAGEVAEVVLNPHLHHSAGPRATAEEMIVGIYDALSVESRDLDAGPAKGEHA